jgi:glutamate-1-semialdehyde 2,1-aminomutase
VVLVIDETHTISSGLGGCTALDGLEPDILVAGKAIAGGIPCGILGLSRETAERVWSAVPWKDPRERQSAHLGFGGTLAGNPLAIAAMRAVLEKILVAENYKAMIANAARLAEGARSIIARHGLPWHVTQIGARAEIMFMPKPPRNGAEAMAGRNGLLETLLHAFYLNEGILVTPFHTMFLMCPATTAAQVDKHTQVFAGFAALVKRHGL